MTTVTELQLYGGAPGRDDVAGPDGTVWAFFSASTEVDWACYDGPTWPTKAEAIAAAERKFRRVVWDA